MQVVTDQVIEVEPSTILRFLEGCRPCTVLDTPDGYKMQVEFTYSTSDDGKIEEKHVGAKNHLRQPVLNSRAIQTLVNGGTVTYTKPGEPVVRYPGEPVVRYHVTLVEPMEQHDLRRALKQAFHAHKDHDFGGKDPRRVWNDFDGSDEFDYIDYIDLW